MRGLRISAHQRFYEVNPLSCSRRLLSRLRLCTSVAFAVLSWNRSVDVASSLKKAVWNACQSSICGSSHNRLLTFRSPLLNWRRQRKVERPVRIEWCPSR